MDYVPILRLTLNHAFYGDDTIPIQVQPTDLRAIEQSGLSLRANGSQVIILAELDRPRPASISLSLITECPEALIVTEGVDRNVVPHLRVPLGTDHNRFAELVPQTTHTRSEPNDLAQIDVDLSTSVGSDIRDLTLEFDAVCAFWVYQLMGAETKKGLQVIDPEGEIGFDDLGTHPLPNGQDARVLRSDRPIAARARPLQRFALQEAGQAGPTTLISVLPAAGVQFKTVTDPVAGARLQSDIFVSLW